MRKLQALHTALLVLTPSLAAQEVRLLRADNPPVWGDDPALVEELRIGSLLGEEAYTFGSITGLTVTLDSTIWVADGQAVLIRRYAWDGSYLGNVGRRGEGPGEFQNPIGLRTLPDGRVAVWDPMNTRIHGFHPDGSYDSSIRVPVRGILAGRDLEELEVDRTGHVYAINFHVSEQRRRAERMHWIRLNPEGGIQDTLYAAPSDREGSHHGIRTFTAVSPFGHLIFGRNADYAFWWTDSGGVEHRLERDYEPVRYTRAERREAQELERGYSERNGRPERLLPDSKPPWSLVQVDLDGRLWVSRYVPGQRVEETESERETRLRYDGLERTWGEPVTFDVIDPEGRFLGSVSFPNSARASPTSSVELIRAKGLTVWAIERGEYDEQYLVRYQIDPGR